MPCIFNLVEGLRYVVFLVFDVVLLLDLVCRMFCEKLWIKDRIPTFETFPSVVRVSFSTFLKMRCLFLDVWSVRMGAQD